MYYCIQCKEIHEDKSNVILLFKTSYLILEGRRVDMGICNDSQLQLEKALAAEQNEIS